MVYAGDQWIQLPTKDLYDTQVMAMAINAARDMYEKGQQQIKDFNTTYGDFLTPIEKDQDWYNQNVTGKVRDTINQMYEAGIDPTRSAEGRAILSRLVNNIPVGKVAKLRQSAAAANEYIKNRGILEAKGLYNPDFEQNYLGYSMNNYSTLDNGVWNRTSPAEFQTLKQLTEPWYNNTEPLLLNKDDVTGEGMRYDARNRYYGFLDRHLQDVAAANTPGWQGSVWADYYRDQARRQLIASGNANPTASDIEQQLQKNVAYANREYRRGIKMEADPWAMLEQQARYQQQLASLKNSGRGSGKGSGSGGGSGSSSKKEPASVIQPLYMDLANTITGQGKGNIAGVLDSFDLAVTGGDILHAQRNILSDIYDEPLVDNGTTSKRIFEPFNTPNPYGGLQGTFKTVEVPRFSGGPLFEYKQVKNADSSRRGQGLGLRTNISIGLDEMPKFDLYSAPKLNEGMTVDKISQGANTYINRISKDWYPRQFSAIWKAGSAKVDPSKDEEGVSNILAKVKGKNLNKFTPDDLESVFSKEEIVARAMGASGALLQQAINKTAKLRKLMKNASYIYGAGKVFGSVNASDNNGQFNTYGTVHAVDKNGDDLDIDDDIIIRTDIQSYNNPDIENTSYVNLAFDPKKSLVLPYTDNRALGDLFGVTHDDFTRNATIPTVDRYRDTRYDDDEDE